MIHRPLHCKTLVRAALLTTALCGIQAQAGVQEPVTLSAGLLGMPAAARPVDDFIRGDGLDGVDTLRDLKRAEGPFPLGKALLTIGQTQFLGLNPNLNSFDVSTLETPLGGEFPVNEERTASARQSRPIAFDRVEARMQKAMSTRRSNAKLGEWVY